MIGTPAAASRSCEVLRRADAVAQVRLLDHLLEPARDRLEVVAGEAAVGREALGQDQQVAAALGPARRRSWPGSRRCWRGRPSWPTSCSRRRARTSPARSPSACGPAWPASRVLMNQAFSAKRQASRKNGLLVAVAQLAHAAQVLQRDRLPAAGVVGDGHHHERHALAVRSQRALERGEVDVALERVHAATARGPRRSRGRAPRPPRPRCWRASCRSGCCWGRPRPASSTAVEQDALGGAALVRRDDVAEAGQVLDHVAEAVEGAAPGVRLVALHDRAPLRRRHRAGAGVGQQVDEHVLRAQAGRRCSPPPRGPARAPRGR